jgi:hypothetical protein
MIVKQHYSLINPTLTPKEVIDSVLMKKFVKESKNKNQDRQINKDIARVSKPRKKGWQVSIDVTKKTTKEPLKIIPEVLRKCETHFECDFALLHTVIFSVVWIKSFEILGIERIRTMSLSEFMLAMIRDKIIKLYLKDSPSFVVLYIERTIISFYELLSYATKARQMLKQENVNEFLN